MSRTDLQSVNLLLLIYKHVLEVLIERIIKKKLTSLKKISKLAQTLNLNLLF